MASSERSEPHILVAPAAGSTRGSGLTRVGIVFINHFYYAYEPPQKIQFTLRDPVIVHEIRWTGSLIVSMTWQHLPKSSTLLNCAGRNVNFFYMYAYYEPPQKVQFMLRDPVIVHKSRWTGSLIVVWRDNIYQNLHWGPNNKFDVIFFKECARVRPSFCVVSVIVWTNATGRIINSPDICTTLKRVFWTETSFLRLELAPFLETY